jgi:endonuclease/exonuclease/phosphatase family metal-dependent hydrolase
MPRVITCNLQANQRRWRYVSDARKIKKQRPDVVCLQEVGGSFKARAIRAAFGLRYRMVRPKGPASAVPILFRRRKYRLLDVRRWHLSDETFVGRPGAGPATLREKEATWITLRVKSTGKIEHHASCHLAPSIYLDVREELHEEQVQNLAKLSDAMHKKNPKSDRYIAGDFNTDDDAHLRVLREAGLDAGREIKTHRHGPLDHIFSDQDGRRSKLGNLYTDHDALIGDF